MMIDAAGGAAKATGTESYATSNDDAEIEQLRREVQLLRGGGGALGPSGGAGGSGGATQFDPTCVPPPSAAHVDVASVYAASRA